MSQYYYLTSTLKTENIIQQGIQPMLDPILTKTPFASFFSDSYIPLWKNLKIYGGKFFPTFMEMGYELLSVEMPDSHPVDRNLGLSAILHKDSGGIASLIKNMQIPVDPKQFIDRQKIRQFVETLRGLPRKQQTQDLTKWTLEKLAEDEKIIKQILLLTSDENWYRVCGAYKTLQRIPAASPYKIQRYQG